MDIYMRYNIQVDEQGRPKQKLPLCYQEAYILFKQLEMQQPPEARTIDVADLERGFEPTFISPQVKERFARFAQKVAMHNSANNPLNRAFPDAKSDSTSTARTKTNNMYVAPHFACEYGDTYYYYFYFVNKIKTN